MIRSGLVVLLLTFAAGAQEVEVKNLSSCDLLAEAEDEEKRPKLETACMMEMLLAATVGTIEAMGDGSTAADE